MAPPPGMDMGMQYFMPADTTGSMSFMDGSQHPHHTQGGGAQQQQGQHPQQAQQQQLMLMQVCMYSCFFFCVELFAWFGCCMADVHCYEVLDTFFMCFSWCFFRSWSR